MKEEGNELEGSRTRGEDRHHALLYANGDKSKMMDSLLNVTKEYLEISGDDREVSVNAELRKGGLEMCHYLMVPIVDCEILKDERRKRQFKILVSHFLKARAKGDFD